MTETPSADTHRGLVSELRNDDALRASIYGGVRSAIELSVHTALLVFILLLVKGIQIVIHTLWNQKDMVWLVVDTIEIRPDELIVAADMSILILFLLLSIWKIMKALTR